jgi:hypothetical protein
MKSETTLIEAIAQAATAWENCLLSGNTEWLDRWYCRLEYLEKFLPSGAGIDNGSSIDVGGCEREKVVIVSCYHVMNGSGFYEGWLDFTVVVTPSFMGQIDVKVNLASTQGFQSSGIHSLDTYLEAIFYEALIDTFEEKEAVV